MVHGSYPTYAFPFPFVFFLRWVGDPILGVEESYGRRDRREKES